MNRGFTPAVVERMRPALDRIIEELMDKMSRAESIDLIKDFAYPLPVQVICELLGVPRELHDRCVVLSNDVAVWMGDPGRPADKARVAQSAARELEGYFEPGPASVRPSGAARPAAAHNRHLAFGGDAHVCIGSTLARLEGRLAIGGVTRRFPDLRLADETPDWGSNVGFRGLNTLRVHV